MSPSVLRSAARSSRNPSTVIALSALATSHRLKLQLLLLDPHTVEHCPLDVLVVGHFPDLADGLFEPIREPEVEPQLLIPRELLISRFCRRRVAGPTA